MATNPIDEPQRVSIQLAWWRQIPTESRTDRSTTFAPIRTLAKHAVASAQLVGPVLLVTSGTPYTDHTICKDEIEVQKDIYMLGTTVVMHPSHGGTVD